MSAPAQPAAAPRRARTRAAELRAAREPVGSRRIYGARSGAERAVWVATDAVALLALAALLAIVWWPTFGTSWVWVATLGGAAVGLLAGLVAAWRRWGPLATAVLTAALYCLTGAFLAMPSSTRWGVVPTARSLRGLAQAPASVWKGVLTIAPPIGETWNLLVAPMISGLLVGLLGISIALRSARPLLAWVPAAVAILAAIALGGPRPVLVVPVGLGLLFVILVWAAYRRHQLGQRLLGSPRAIDPSTVLLGALVLAVAGGVAGLAAPALQPSSRAIARDQITPPLDPREYGSPLQAYRGYVTDRKDEVELHVDGLPKGARVRIATMDGYDGVAMIVSNSGTQSPDGGAFRRIGERVPTVPAGTEATVDVTVRGYDGPWLPTLGALKRSAVSSARADAISDTLFYNPASGTALTTAGLQAGDRYRLTAVLAPPVTDAQIRAATEGGVSVASMDAAPDLAKDIANQWTRGAATSGDAALKLRDALRKGYYSHGDVDEENAPLSGHNAWRIAKLLDPSREMVGDEEQYAVAMALMARSIGIPSRVVLGFTTGSAGSVDLKGDNVTAWTELNFAGLGWVAVNACPDHDRKPTDKPVPQPDKPRPQVQNPPPPVQKPDKLPPDNTNPEKPNPNSKRPLNVDWRFLALIAAGVGLPLVVIVLPIALIVGAKVRRRRSRRRAPTAAARFAGGWAELIDRARDLGGRPVAADTRSEQAEYLAQAFPRVAEHDPHELARLADAGVFAPDRVGDEHASGYWVAVRDAMKGLGRSRSWGHRLRAIVSLRSLRRLR